MTILDDYLQNKISIPPSLANDLVPFFKKEFVPKGTFLVKQNSYCKKMVLLKNGYLRCYFPTDKKNVTHWVFWSKQIVTDVSSFYMGIPSKWNFQFITDCEVYAISIRAYQELERLFPDWHRYEKNLLLKLITTLENRVYSLISMSSEERYNFLYQVHPQIFNQIPLTYIASMLNMTPETLSRIRAQVNS